MFKNTAAVAGVVGVPGIFQMPGVVLLVLKYRFPPRSWMTAEFETVLWTVLAGPVPK